jgi:hypothetical protein
LKSENEQGTKEFVKPEKEKEFCEYEQGTNLRS